MTGSREDFHLQVDAQRGAQTKAPRQPALPNCIRSDLQAASLVGWTSRRLAGVRDRDRPGLHCLSDLAHEVDVQEPVLQARTLDLHSLKWWHAVLAVVTVKITLSIAALMTNVEKRPAKYSSKRIISSSCVNLSRFGEAGLQPQIYLLPWASEQTDVSANRNLKHVPHARTSKGMILSASPAWIACQRGRKSGASASKRQRCCRRTINAGSRPHAARQRDDERPQHRVLRHNRPDTHRQHRQRRLIPSCSRQ